MPGDSHFPPRPTRLAHDWVASIARPGDLLIDATAGNGHDTLHLAQLAGPNGKVLAFDIQPAAIQSARTRIENAGLLDRVHLIQQSHANLADHAAPATASVIMFNLGYLPGQEHQLITTPGETLTALNAATSILKPGGLLTIICYPGHPGGDHETQAVLDWATTLAAQNWRIARYSAIATQRPTPILLAVHKSKP
jgi:tRNA1(Val) A37 N6-methylase TrmN6